MIAQHIGTVEGCAGGGRCPGGESVGEMVQGNAFVIEVPLVKAWENAQGELWFEGVASSTALDRQRERMSAQAIEQMARSGRMALLPAHSAGPLDDLGTVEECWADDSQLIVRGRLDNKDARARRLYDRCAAGDEYGLSVGGKVLAAHWEPGGAVGKSVRVLDAVKLDHIALCRPSEAVNPDTYLGVMAKAADGCAVEVTTQALECGVAEGSDEMAGLADRGAEGCESEEATEGRRAGTVRDLLLKAARQFAEATRCLWGTGDGEEPAHGSEGGALERSVAPDDLAELREQLAQAVADLSCVAKSLSAERVGGALGVRQGEVEGSGAAPTEQSRICRGKSSLDGQQRVGSRQAHLWKGVL